MRKILFLDVDGVLNTERQHWHCQMNGIAPIDRFGYAFDPEAVANLATILTETEAEIVISSSWKSIGLANLLDLWEFRKLPGKIIDTTPNTISDEFLLNANLDDMELVPIKGMEIKEWLTNHGKQVSHYVIIDDESGMLPEQQQHFVQTNPQFGITKRDVERTITILQ